MQKVGKRAARVKRLSKPAPPFVALVLPTPPPLVFTRPPLVLKPAAALLFTGALVVTAVLLRQLALVLQPKPTAVTLVEVKARVPQRLVSKVRKPAWLKRLRRKP